MTIKTILMLVITWKWHYYKPHFVDVTIEVMSLIISIHKYSLLAYYIRSTMLGTENLHIMNTFICLWGVIYLAEEIDKNISLMQYDEYNNSGV